MCVDNLRHCAPGGARLHGARAGGGGGGLVRAGGGLGRGAGTRGVRGWGARQGPRQGREVDQRIDVVILSMSLSKKHLHYTIGIMIIHPLPFGRYI